MNTSRTIKMISNSVVISGRDVFVVSNTMFRRTVVQKKIIAMKKRMRMTNMLIQKIVLWQLLQILILLLDNDILIKRLGNKHYLFLK